MLNEQELQEQDWCRVHDCAYPCARCVTNQVITEADQHAYSKLPEGWFEWFDLRVRCPEFRLKRLEERGLVGRRITGAWPDIEVRYRRIDRKKPRH